MSEKKSDFIDFYGIFRRLLKNWYWFVISVAVCCTLGWLYSMRVVPMYEVRASIQLNNEAGVSTLVAAGMGGVSDLFGGNSVADDEVKILTSHSLLRDASSRLSLNREHYKRLMPTVYVRQSENYPVEVVPVEGTIDTDTLTSTLVFAVKAKPSGKTSVNVKVGDRVIFSDGGMTLPATVECEYGKFRVERTPAYPEGETVKTKVLVTSHDQAAENLRSQLNVALASKHSQIIEMQMIANDTRYAVNLLNTMISLYNDRARKENLESTSASAAFLSDRLETVREHLDATENRLASYKSGAGMTDLQADAAVVYEQMHKAEEEMTAQQLIVEMERLTLDMVRASSKDNSLLPYHTSNETASAMIKTYNNLALQRMKLESGVKGDNTTLRRLDEQIGAIRGNIIETLESSLERSREMLAQLRRVYERARAQVTDIPEKEHSFRQIARQQAIEEQLYTFLLQKREEASIMMLEVNPKVKVIDAAYVLNEDVSTSRFAIMLIAFVFGLMIPPFIMYVRTFPRSKRNTQLS